jgi:hypothetical protein
MARPPCGWRGATVRARARGRQPRTFTAKVWRGGVRILGLFLVSDASAYVTGDTIRVMGGSIIG